MKIKNSNHASTIVTTVLAIVLALAAFWLWQFNMEATGDPRFFWAIAGFTLLGFIGGVTFGMDKMREVRQQAVLNAREAQEPR